MKLRALAALVMLAAGCSQSLTMRVVDIDAGYKPVAGASISRYSTPRHRDDPWPTTPAETQQTDADGRTTFAEGRGRFVVDAPGKAKASFYSTFAPQTLEIGVGSGSAK